MNNKHKQTHRWVSACVLQIFVEEVVGSNQLEVFAPSWEGPSPERFLETQFGSKCFLEQRRFLEGGLSNKVLDDLV